MKRKNKTIIIALILSTAFLLLFWIRFNGEAVQTSSLETDRIPSLVDQSYLYLAGIRFSQGRVSALETITAIVTAYSSTVDQTNSDPFTTASGERVRDGIVANNCLPFGTKVLINDKEYEVLDRKNRRYGCEWFDIWQETREEALEWGVKRLVIKTYVQN